MSDMFQLVGMSNNTLSRMKLSVDNHTDKLKHIGHLLDAFLLAWIAGVAYGSDLRIFRGSSFSLRMTDPSIALTQT